MGAQLGTMGRFDRQPHGVSNIGDRSHFVRRRVAADPRSADRFSDVLLAVNEAIAHAAEFAYCEARSAERWT